MTVTGVANQPDQQLDPEAEKLAAMPHSERIQTVVVWILEGQSFAAIRDSLTEAWPNEDANALLLEANKEIDNAGGLHSESLRHIYQQMASIGDWSGAARVLKQREELAKENPANPVIPQGVLIPQGQPSSEVNSVDLEDLLDGLSLSLTDDAVTPAVDPSFPFDPPTPDMFIPPEKRKNPGQTSRSELERRYHQVASWLVANNFKKGVAKRLARETWGIGFRQYEAYHKAAYQILNEAADVSHEEEYRRACLYYDHIMETTDDDKIKVAARKAKDELTGIQKARKVAQVGRDGQVVDPVAGTVNNFNLMVAGMTDEQLRKLAAANEVWESATTGGSAPGNNRAEAVDGGTKGSVNRVANSNASPVATTV